MATLKRASRTASTKVQGTSTSQNGKSATTTVSPEPTESVDEAKPLVTAELAETDEAKPPTPESAETTFTTETEPAIDDATKSATEPAIDDTIDDAIEPISPVTGNVASDTDAKPSKGKSKKPKKSTASSQLKTSVRQSDLAAALAKLTGLTVSGHEALQFVHLNATSKALQLSAFNLKTQCRISINADTELPGSVFIRPRIEVLQQLEGNLTLEFLDQGIIHSEQGLLQIPIARYKEFPQLKMPDEHVCYSIGSNAFKEALGCTTFADTDVKSAYSGVQILLFTPFQEGNNPKTVTPIKGLATNCEVVVRYRSHPQVEGEPKHRLVLPLNACQQIRDILPSEGDVTLKVSTVPNKPTVIQVTTGDVEITTQTSVYQEADLETHLPDEQKLSQWSQVKVEAVALKGCIARHTSTFGGADKKTRDAGMPISLKIDGNQIHTSSSYHDTSWNEVLEQENSTMKEGKAINLLLNLQILQKAISIVAPSPVILEISPDTSTILLSSSSGKVELLTTTMQTV